MITRIESLKKFLELDPNDSFTKYAIALESIKEKNFVEAIIYLQSIIDNNQDYLAAYQQLGRILIATNQKEEAIKVYEKGIQIAKKQNEKHTQEKLEEALERLL
jgi:tetratricopeptide (TPR) repeat protein